MEGLIEQISGDTIMLRSMLDNISDGVYFTDLNRTILYWNNGAEAISGFSAEEVIGRGCRDNILMHVDDKGDCVCTAARCPLVKCFEGTTEHVEKLYLHHKDGHRVPVRICASPIYDKEGQLIGGLETFHDITQEVSALQEIDSLKEAALVCPITGVGNRSYCEEVLDTELHKLGAGGAAVGVVDFSIDGFDAYNERFGHEVGDLVLKIVARTISTDLRAFDFVGRWEGEEFVVVLPRVSPTHLAEAANRLKTLIATSSAEVTKGKLAVSVSGGATLAKSGERPDELVARAAKLMYASRKGGCDQVTIG